MSRPVHEHPLARHRVAAISSQPFPSPKADCEQLANTVAALGGEGVRIDLIIPRKWRQLATLRVKRKQDILDYYQLNDDFGLVELLRTPFAPFVLDTLTHGLMAPAYATVANYDIVYTRHPLVAFVALTLGKKVVFETYRLYDRLGSPLARRLVTLRSQRLLGVITHSPPAKDSLTRAGAIDDKVTVVPNGFNPDVLLPRLTRAEARARLGLPDDKRIACYAGRIDLDKGILTLTEMAARTPEIQYLLIGYSAKDDDDWILRAALQRGLRNVTRLPWVPIRQLVPYLYASDVLVIPPSAAPLVDYGRTVLPLKTYLYLAAGRPILAPALSDTKGVLNPENAALVEPDCPDDAQHTIERLMSDHDWAHALGKQAKIDSERYTWQKRAQRIVGFLEGRLRAREE